MEIDQLITSISLASCPFPYIGADGRKHDGLFLSQNGYCKTCNINDCVSISKSRNKETISLCQRGFSFYYLEIGESEVRILINGILDNDSPKFKLLKKNFRNYVIPKEKVLFWRENCKSLIYSLSDIVSDEIKQQLEILHDVKTAFSMLFRNAEAIISSSPGRNFEEKLSNADENTTALYKTVGLLEQRLALVDIVTNPEACKYGEKKHVAIYKLIDTLAKQYSNLARQKRVQIYVSGNSYNTINSYASISTIPLVLIDNAVKYSAENQAVQIDISEGNHWVEFKVKSYSPKISAEEREKIFNRGFRGFFASKVSSKGAGLVLCQS